ncbi:gluconate 2-dehydrogenase subunit 3 family protein [Blastococcus sp. SYSU D00669]
MTSKRDWEIVRDDSAADERLFFTEAEWLILDAATARIIPTDQDPGAREASVVRFIDRYLSGTRYIYASADGSGFLRLAGKEADAWQTRVTALQQRYREGLRTVDRVSGDMFQTPFTELDPDQQDEVLAALSGWPKPERVDIRPMVDGEEARAGSGGAPPSNQPIRDDDLDFFPMLVLHTRQGFYSDPVYGGNRNHVGWEVIGFPGPRSLSLTQTGQFSTVEYMLPDAEWPYAATDTGS